MRLSSTGSAPWNFRAPQPTGLLAIRARMSKPRGDDEDLGVGMAVQPHALARRHADEDDGDPVRADTFALQRPGAVLIFQLLSAEDSIGRRQALTANDSTVSSSCRLNRSGSSI